MDILGSENINESIKTHFLIYKITNTINGKYYIGQHKTEDPYDDYMGSGNIIQTAIHKHGLSCFTKEILFDFDNFEDMNNKEKELVPLSACYPNNKMSYNLKEGGSAGKMTKKTCDKMSNARKQYFANMSNAERIKYSNSIKGRFKGEKNGMYGKNPWANLSEQRKAEIRKEVSKRTKGSKNPMFKYPYELVVQMRDEYNKNGYNGVKAKYNYAATECKLLCLFKRNNLSVIRKLKHHAYTTQELLEAIDMINEHGFEYYANYIANNYAFKPVPSNFKKVLARHNLLSALHIKI